MGSQWEGYTTNRNSIRLHEPLAMTMILLHDGPCIVIDKPGGLLTQGPPGIDSAELRVRAYIRQRESLLGKFYLGVPHRLDRPVSGAMVFARHARAAKRLSQQFERREIKKIYWAIVQGVVEPLVGTWEDHLLKLPNEAHVQVVSPDLAGAQFARLHYRVIQQMAEKSWLQIELETGRTHQIRVQAARAGTQWREISNMAAGCRSGLPSSTNVCGGLHSTRDSCHFGIRWKIETSTSPHRCLSIGRAGSLLGQYKPDAQASEPCRQCRSSFACASCSN